MKEEMSCLVSFFLHLGQATFPFACSAIVWISVNFFLQAVHWYS